MISFIVVTYNSTATIADCLQHILDDDHDATGGECEIIVVDNASADDTREIVRRFSHVKLIASPKNLGFGGGSTPEYVIMVRVDDSKAAGYAGTTAAGPVFNRLSNWLLQYLNIQPVR